MAAEFRQHDEHGFPLPTRFEDITYQDDLPPRRQVSMKSKRLVLFGLLVAVVIPLVFGERLISAGRWQLAHWFNQRATQKYRVGDLRGALAEMNRAVDWRPDSWEMRVNRSQLREKSGDLEGSVEDLDESIALLEESEIDLPKRRQRMDPSYVLSDIYVRRGWLHVRLNNVRQALDDANRAVSLYTSPHTLNHRAYVRAILNQELAEGLVDIDQAIAQTPGKDPALIDTRAYLLYRLGRNEEALAEMNEAIRLVQHPLRRSALLRPSDAYADRYADQLAVMYHHRGLIYEKLGRKTEAEADLRRADSLGYDPTSGNF